MDIPKWNRVYVKAVEDNIEIKPEYVYMTIPSEYMCTYMRLLNLMADIGKQLLDDCNAACKGNGKNIVNCWNMFQSALAAHAIGRIEEANFLVNYINKQIQHIYHINGKEYNQIAEFPISEDGKIKAICKCDESMKVLVTEETNAAYEDYLLHKDDGKVFVKSDN